MAKNKTLGTAVVKRVNGKVKVYVTPNVARKMNPTIREWVITGVSARQHVYAATKLAALKAALVHYNQQSGTSLKKLPKGVSVRLSSGSR